MQYQIEICFNRLLNGYFVGVHRQVVPWYLRNTRFGENLLFLLSRKIDIGFIFVATGSDVVSIWSGKTQLTTTPNPLYSDNKLVTKTRVTWFMWQQSSLYQMSLGKLTTFWFGSSWFYVGLVLTVLGSFSGWFSLFENWFVYARFTYIFQRSFSVEVKSFGLSLFKKFKKFSSLSNEILTSN